MRWATVSLSTGRIRPLQRVQRPHSRTSGARSKTRTTCAACSSGWSEVISSDPRNSRRVSRERLLGESLDYLVAEGSERTVDTHIKNLRAKLGDSGWIETVRGFGYRFSGTPQ